MINTMKELGDGILKELVKKVLKSEWKDSTRTRCFGKINAN
jgi:hypothetical protein